MAERSAISVEVFDILDCRTTVILKITFLKSGLLQTPVVGLWVDGELVETAFGYDGRMLSIYRTCGLSETDSERLILAVLNGRRRIPRMAFSDFTYPEVLQRFKLSETRRSGTSLPMRRSGYRCGTVGDAGPDFRP